MDRVPCPTCGKPPARTCRCPIGDMACADGHSWIACPAHRDRAIPTGGFGGGHAYVRSLGVQVGPGSRPCLCKKGKEAAVADPFAEVLSQLKASADVAAGIDPGAAGPGGGLDPSGPVGDADGGIDPELAFGGPRRGNLPGPDPSAFLGEAPRADPQPKPKAQAALAAWESWRANPDQANTRNFLEVVAPTIRSSLNYHAPGSSAVLTGQAKLMALDAARRYDPAKGASVLTHIANTLNGLRRERIRANNPLSVNDQAFRDHQYLRQQSDRFLDENGRAPDVEELSEYSGMPLARTRRLLRFRPGIASGQLDRMTLDEEGDPYNPPVERDRSAEIMGLLRDISDDPRERFIMDHTLGLDGAEVLPGKEIARRLNVSEGLVSQLKAKIQARAHFLQDKSFI